MSSNHLSGNSWKKPTHQNKPTHTISFKQTYLWEMTQMYVAAKDVENVSKAGKELETPLLVQ